MLPTLLMQLIHILFFIILQVVFDPDKRDKTQYMEKFQRNSRLVPSLTQFGGCHVDGFIAVTASGLVSLENTKFVKYCHRMTNPTVRLVHPAKTQISLYEQYRKKNVLLPNQS